MAFWQVLFDILPLRLVPPLMFGGIVYGLVGLVPTVPGFWKFMLTLVLFNLTTASVVLWLSIAFASISVASLVGTLVMLFKYVYLSLRFFTDSRLMLAVSLSHTHKSSLHGAVGQSGYGRAGFAMAPHNLILPCCV